MVSVIIKKDQAGRIVGFTCSGHADYAEKGSDIVCASISALTHTSVLALERLTDLRLELKQNAKKGLIECSWLNQKAANERPELIVQIMLIGLEEIQQQYPDYLKVSEVEV